MIRIPGAQAKKRKTSGSIPDATFELPRKATPTQEEPSQIEPTVQANLPESPKGSTDVPRSPVVMATADDPDAVVITGFGFSKPADTILSKHTTSPAPSILESGPSKAKLSDYAGLEFKELCSGFASRLEASYEMEKNLLKMLNNKHEESLAQTELALGDLRKNLAVQQDARTQSEDKYKLALVELKSSKSS